MSPEQREWGNLPADVSTFVGRRRELTELRERLSASRLVTLTGPGGVGKTRLALRVASESRRAFPAGAWFVDLASLAEPADLAETVATAIGAIKQSNRPALAQLRHFLRDRSALIVLDNCEHLVQACAVLTDDLLRAAPRLRVLATSRQTLRVHGEHVFDVLPMPVPQGEGLDLDRLEDYDSVALLLARATDTNPRFAITDEDRSAVARLCARLDGIPLAIELAAARLRALSVTDVLARLEHRFELLACGGPAAVPRQQTLRALIDWSHALCSPEQQTAWARLSIFVGSFDLAAAEAVAGGSGLLRSDIADIVGELVDRSILLAESFGGRVRYRLLETLREYGRYHLTQSGEMTKLAVAHRDYYLRRVEVNANAWYGPRQAEWLADARSDHANVAAAFEHSLGDDGQADKALAIAAGLRWFWIAGGYLTEGRRWIEAALKATSEPTYVRTMALCVDAFLALLLGDPGEANARLEEIEGLPDTDGPGEVRGYVAEMQGMAAFFSGDLAEAMAYFENALAEYQTAGPVSGEVSVRFQLALTYLFSGRSEEARKLCDSSLRVSERTGARWVAAYILYDLAVDRWLCGDYSSAIDLLRRSFAIAYEFHDNVAIVHVTELLAWIAASDLRHREAAVLLGVARAMWEGLGTTMTAFGPHLAECHDRAEQSAREALGDRRFTASLTAAMHQDTQLAITRALGINDNQSVPVAAATSSLTNREEQVAELVAKGLSNQQISDELVLSSRTVETHVQHILTKLGMNRRAQVAAWVAERRSAERL
ncbi:LuxR C-terminal-related transcriptional regulator [Nocardia sp. R6R-6]|uniref:LuxR C-terminal-related transcriptional regulator n=1 Tax=Nocardia sp. R6R-6 TaxID=3459303 RepID=UPI00403E213C